MQILKEDKRRLKFIHVAILVIVLEVIMSEAKDPALPHITELLPVFQTKICAGFRSLKCPVCSQGEKWRARVGKLGTAPISVSSAGVLRFAQDNPISVPRGGNLSWGEAGLAVSNLSVLL